MSDRDHPTTPAPNASRCFGDGDPLYENYHDTEWAVPVTSENALFERISLEAFQSGLAWITILRKREGFRQAFANFDPEQVAAYTQADVERLLEDPSIVRNRAKITATIVNAQALLALHREGRTLRELMWSYAPAATAHAPASLTELPAKTPQSAALAKELKGLSFRFVGPTTAYASMQACGIVNDHLAGCPRAIGGEAPANA